MDGTFRVGTLKEWRRNGEASAKTRVGFPANRVPLLANPVWGAGLFLAGQGCGPEKLVHHLPERVPVWNPLRFNRKFSVLLRRIGI